MKKLFLLAILMLLVVGFVVAATSGARDNGLEIDENGVTIKFPKNIPEQDINEDFKFNIQETGINAEPFLTPEEIQSGVKKTRDGDYWITQKFLFDSGMDGDNEIYSINIDGSGLTKITNNGYDDNCASWNHNGSYIVFQSYRSNNRDIYKIKSDGSSEQRLTTHSDSDYCPDWNHDGSKVVFGTQRAPTYSTDLYTMNSDGSNKQWFVYSNWPGEAHPNWSPDGSKIAYISWEGEYNPYNVYYGPYPGGSQVLVVDTDGSGDRWPNWNPNSSKIVFEYNTDIYVINVDGTNFTQLTSNWSDRHPSWSPDGSKIGFLSDRTGGSEIFMMDTDGTNITQVTNISTGIDRPDWGLILVPWTYDLSISTTDINLPSEIHEGETVDVEITVHNNGNAPIENALIYFYIDDVLKQSNSNADIAAESSTVVSFSWTVEAGSHTLKAKADPYNDIEEENENNNQGEEVVGAEDYQYEILVIPLNWQGTQQDFEDAVNTQLDFFLNDVPLNDCREKVKIKMPDVSTYNFNFTCGQNDCNVDAVKQFATQIEDIGDLEKYDVIAGYTETSPCPPTAGCSNGVDTIWVKTNHDSITAHEIGHLFGLEDEYCSNPAGSKDCRCNDGNEFGGCYIQQGFSYDINYLDLNLDCNASGGNCCGPSAGLADCSQSNYSVCCLGNINSLGGRAIMSYANAPGPRAYDNHSKNHLETFSQLNCEASRDRQVQDIIDVNLFIFKNDSVMDNGTILAQGTPSEYYQTKGLYNLTVLDNGSNFLFAQNFDIQFTYEGPMEAEEDYSSIDYDYRQLRYKIPYTANMHEIRLYKNNSLIFSKMLGFCDFDLVCDSGETYLSCANDCPLNETDSICITETDGVCDPDCAIGIDQDCGCKTPESGMIINHNTLFCDGIYDLNESITINANNITVTAENCTLIGDNNTGFTLFYSGNVMLQGLVLKNFEKGIHVFDSSNNFVTENEFSENSFGVYIESGSGNIIWNNIFTNNSNNSYEEVNSNFWNNSETGNYWDDFENNTGYPNHYKIDGLGDGVDYWPVGKQFPPYFTSSPILMGIEGQLYTYDVDAVDPENQSMTYSLIQYPPNMTIDNITGVIEWIPQDGGEFYVEVIVNDGLLQSIQNFTIITQGILSCGEYVTMNTVLEYDLINCSSGLTINAENITLDCAGHTIDGAGTNYGIYLVDKDQVTIKNCNIQEFDLGIYMLILNNNNLIINNTLANNNIGFYAYIYSFNNTLVNNIIENNSQGIYFGSDFSNTRITNNTIKNNNDYGVYSITSNSNNFSNNIIENNDQGIYLRDSDNNNFWHNEFIDNNISAFEDNFSENNSWNFSDTGNYWSDFLDNEGYPNYYNISGNGTGVDWHPSGSELIQCGDSITEDTTMYNDIINCSGTAINIAADNITFDCNGHLIDGLGGSQSYNGIYLSGSIDNVTVKNCVLTNWGYNEASLYLAGSDNNTFINITTYNNDGAGIFLDDASKNNKFKNIQVHDNYGYSSGLLVYHSSDNNSFEDTSILRVYRGIRFIGSHNNSFTDLVVSETGFHGISLESASTDNHFTNLLCEDNERYAISTSYDSNHCTYTNITANRNRWGGISISTTDNILQDITVINNLYSGLQVWKDRNNITNVNATNNTGHGIQMNSKNNILTNVTTNRNLMEGIYLQSLSENNEFTGITAIDNAENGIFLNAASNNRLANLTSVGNKQGILLENAENNNISTCRFIDNAQYGAYLNNSGYNAFWDNNFTNNGINAYEDITSINSWNNSETGNNWDDFENNNGHPYTYIIDGPGDGIDWHPNGASTYISLSDCAVLSSPGETYILTADIINHTDHACMDISANNVVLDCLGHLIDGDDNAQIGIGIVRGSEEVTNITVKNCVLSDWKYETIKIYRGHQNILENINMSSGTEDGLWMYFSDNNRVTGMKSTDNPGLGFVISDSDYNNFTDIVANNNVGGIYAQRTNYFNFENIDVNNNSFGGLVLQEASNNKIIDLNVNNSQHLVFGSIHIWLDSDNNIFRNVVTQNNVAGGITIENSDNNSFTNVTINNNQNGVSLQDSDYNTFWNNNFMNNNVSAYEDSTSNDNSWNLSEVGNYWDDFINNSGYPTHYNISGPGDGIDWWPIWTFINEPPVLAPIGNREVNESETLIIDVDATDPENYTLTYYTNAGDVLPSAFAFNATTGIFEWTPTKWDPGIYEVTFNVTDGELWDEETITITVVIEKHFYAGYGLGVPYNYYDNITGGGVCNIFGGCEPIIDGFDYTDSAFCLGQNYCVLDGVCYPGDGSVILDIDGSSKHEAICVGFGWWDLDAGGGDSNDPTPLPGMEVCELGNHTWAKAGKNPVSSVGEYEWSFNDWGCCGDDNGEHFGCNTDFPEICACCNDQNDIVGYDGSCVQTKKAKLKKESEVVEPPIKEPTQRTASRG